MFLNIIDRSDDIMKILILNKMKFFNIDNLINCLLYFEIFEKVFYTLHYQPDKFL
jgi:hypothetical protein